MGGPDKVLVVKQNVHPYNAGIVLNVSEQFVSVALVKWIHKTSDFSVVSNVEHPILWSYICEKRKERKIG